MFRTVAFTCCLAVASLFIITHEPVRAADALPLQPSQAAVIEVPLRTHPTGLMALPVRINGVETNLVLDTGAGATVLHQGATERLRIKPEGSKAQAGATGTGAGGAGLATQSAPGNVLEIGGYTWKPSSVTVMDLGHVVQAFASDPDDKLEVAGVLGADFLAPHRAVIDYGRHVMRFEP